MGSMQAGAGGQSESVPLAAEVRRREMVLLLILASVQFTSIVDFMVVMPLGPQLRRKLAYRHRAVWLDRRVVHGCGGPRGAFGLVDHGPVRPQVGVLDALRGLSAGDALLRAFDRVLHVARRPGAHGRLLEEFWAGLALAIIADVFPEERRGRATGILMSAFAAASVIGVPTGIYLGGELAGTFRSWFWPLWVCRCWSSA